jgi:iron complex outermembrane recepter protein
MKKIVLLIGLMSFSFLLFAQNDTTIVSTDSLHSKTLDEVIIKAYNQNRKLIDVAAPINYVGQSQLNRFNTTSILPALNINPGVRMEERSPGSYRLNIRGSSLRSPFGVRDVKVYWNDIPLTDPGGNTYLNELGFYNFQSIEIIKGPAGSLYGAGIGGAMLINSLPNNWQKSINVDYTYGSFATNNINANIRFGNENNQNNFSYSHQTSDGYRQQTQMRRDIATWETKLKATDKQTIHAYILYSDLFYQTPGALTLAQYNADPKEARPGSGSAPGAVQNKAAIYQKTFIAGFSSEYHINEHWQNITAVYGAYTDFLNPGIRIYEIRNEPHFGGRSVFQYNKKINETALQINFGTEAQKGFFNTKDFNNNNGVTDSLQTDDNINSWDYMIFAQADLKLPHGFIITAGVSYNKSSVQFTRLSNVPPTLQTRTFENKLPPRLAILKKITETVSLYGSIARGFSTPAISELLRSDGIIGTNLQPEDGMDYEIGLRGSLLRGKLYFDVNAFFFHLKNTIVQRIDTNGVYYYVNAGSTRQNGIEGYLSYQLIDNSRQWVSAVKLFVSYAWDDFHYINFEQVGTNFSGNNMPGVAPQIVTAGFDVNTKTGFYTNVTYNYTDKIWLNDANTDRANSYNLLGARIGYKNMIHKKCKLNIFAGADNLFNIKYSLGNDINAAAGKYYNAAPGINYYAGISLSDLL